MYVHMARVYMACVYMGRAATIRRGLYMLRLVSQVNIQEGVYIWRVCIYDVCIYGVCVCV